MNQSANNCVLIKRSKHISNASFEKEDKIRKQKLEEELEDELEEQILLQKEQELNNIGKKLIYALIDEIIYDVKKYTYDNIVCFDNYIQCKQYVIDNKLNETYIGVTGHKIVNHPVWKCKCSIIKTNNEYKIFDKEITHINLHLEENLCGGNIDVRDAITTDINIAINSTIEFFEKEMNVDKKDILIKTSINEKKQIVHIIRAVDYYMGVTIFVEKIEINN